MMHHHALKMKELDVVYHAIGNAIDDYTVLVIAVTLTLLCLVEIIRGNYAPTNVTISHLLHPILS